MPDNEKRGGAGNFANDPKKASEAGRKGGEHSNGGQKQHEQSQHGGNRQQGGADHNKDRPGRQNDQR
ncbi:general stress protein [Kaistia sp. MMO-174]|uniref:general stress protein n=1 Tax=Kaistia sp. MMO-174 TaxID=3081256 RepID=UPI003015F245